MNLVLGTVLFLTPQLFGFADLMAPAWNAWITGTVVVVLLAVAIFAFAEWEEWVNLLAGLWAVASPWVLGFVGNPGAIGSHVLLGLAVSMLSTGIGWYVHRNSPRATA